MSIQSDGMAAFYTVNSLLRCLIDKKILNPEDVGSIFNRSIEHLEKFKKDLESESQLESLAFVVPDGIDEPNPEFIETEEEESVVNYDLWMAGIDGAIELVKTEDNKLNYLNA